MSTTSANHRRPGASRTKPTAAKLSKRSPSQSCTSSTQPPICRKRSEYAIAFTWPNGKRRYLTRIGVCVSIDDAQRFTQAEAGRIMRHQYKDARLVWGIVTTRKRIDKL